VVNAPDDTELEYPFFKARYHRCNDYLSVRSLRSLFDSNKKLRDYLLNNFDEEKKNRNLLFYLKAENERLTAVESRYEILTQVEKIDINNVDIPDNVVIYGAGNLGKALCKKLNAICKISCLVDRKPDMKEYNGVPILSYDEFIRSEYRNELVIVSPAYLIDKIASDLNKDNVSNVVSVEKYFCI